MVLAVDGGGQIDAARPGSTSAWGYSRFANISVHSLCAGFFLKIAPFARFSTETADHYCYYGNFSSSSFRHTRLTAPAFMDELSVPRRRGAERWS